MRNQMLRTQILLEPRLHQRIAEIADQEQQSFSSVVRETLELGLNERKRRMLEEAAKALLNEYKTNPELTVFNVLDGEDFNA
jgi:hypothetical protein